MMEEITHADVRQEVQSIMLHRFDPLFHDFEWSAARAGTRRFMNADIYRKGDRYFVEIDVPGVSEDAIEITVEKKTLAITVDRPLGDDDERSSLIQDRPFGSFARRFFLGEGLDPDGVEASLDRGVLIVSIPMAEMAKARKIAVSTGRDAIEG